MRTAAGKKIRSFQIKLLLIFLLLTFAVSLTSAYGSSKSKKVQLNEKFRNIAVEMKEAYDKGDLDRVIELYNKNCCKEKDRETQGRPGKEKKEFKRVKKDIRADIYQTLVLSLMALDMPEIGEIYLRKILVFRRGEGTDRYWLSIRETARKKYYVAPRLLVGIINAGINFTLVKPGERFSVMEADPEAPAPEDLYQKDYKFHFKHSRGTQFGISAEYFLTKHLSLNIRPTLRIIKFQYKDGLNWEEKENGYYIKLDFIRRQRLQYIEIPLLLKYRFAQSGAKSKLNPYLQIGGYLCFRTSAFKMIYISIREKLAGSSEDPVQRYYPIDDYNIKNQVKLSDSGFWIGAGIDYDIRGVRLGLEINYKHGFNEIINKEQRWTRDELILGYYDVFDDIKVRNWELSFKVLLPISYKAFRR